MKIFLNFIDFSNISLLIEYFNQAYATKEGNNQLFEASEWVNKVFSLFEIIVNEIIIKYNGLFEDKQLIQYFNILIKLK